MKLATAEPWECRIDIDPAQRLDDREYQKVYLSHYASETIDSWWDKPVAALDSAFRQLRGIIKRESGKA